MIYGIIASEDEFARSGAPQGPQSAGAFDFVNGTYSWGGSTLAASDVTDQTGWIGASGLAVPASGSAAQLIYAAAKTYLATCDCSVVIEVETTTASETVAFNMQNAGGLYYFEIETWPGSEWAAYDNDGVTERWAEEMSVGLSVGIHKIAATMAADHISISVDGATAVRDSETTNLPWGGFPMALFYFGGRSGGSLSAVNVRSFAIYPSQDDADLPSLSV